MRKSFLTAGILLGALVSFRGTALGHESAGEQASAEAARPKLETLLKAVLEGVEGTEIVVSRVTIPPSSSLPVHWHPGEEFAYVLEGAATLWQEGEEDVVARAGEVVKVPLKKVHTATTHEEGATILVFRVHAQGQPERVLVDDPR